MKSYEFNIKTADGVKTVRQMGEDVSDAKYRVCRSENVQSSAISWWRVIPTDRQIARTKSLLRSL